MIKFEYFFLNEAEDPFLDTKHQVGDQSKTKVCPCYFVYAKQVLHTLEKDDVLRIIVDYSTAVTEGDGNRWT